MLVEGYVMLVEGCVMLVEGCVMLAVCQILPISRFPFIFIYLEKKTQPPNHRIFETGNRSNQCSLDPSIFKSCTIKDFRSREFGRLNATE